MPQGGNSSRDAAAKPGRQSRLEVTMIRVIKRYESRKLYDTEESRYISVEDIAAWVREGQDVRVLDNATSDDVTAQILTQIIHDEGKRGNSFLPTELLHDLVRLGEQAVSTGVEQVQGTVDRVLQASIDRLGPVRRAREEMGHLRDRLGKLEQTLEALESSAETDEKPAAKKAAKTTRKTAASKTAASKTSASKTTARKTTARKTAASKATAEKSTAGKTTARKTATRKTAASKTAASKTTARKTTAKAATKKTAKVAEATEVN